MSFLAAECVEKPLPMHGNPFWVSHQSGEIHPKSNTAISPVRDVIIIKEDCTIQTTEGLLIEDRGLLRSDLDLCRKGNKMESNSHHTASSSTNTRIMICIRFFAICLAVSFLRDPACRAATIRVPAEQPTIQAGINAAADGDIVLVADGIYTGDGNRDIDFKGKAITVTSENGPENCIIDCEGIDTDWHRGFVFQSGETVISNLDGFRVKNGYHENGGAVYCLDASPVIVNCSLVNNTAENRGGGLYCEGSSPALIGCFLGDNNAIERGGGLYCAAFCTLNIKDTSFVLNSADGGGGFYGYQTSTVTFDNCLFFMNSASWGGGIFGDCNMTLTTCTFEMNSAETGAGLKHNNVVSFDNCTFSENRASKDGGGLYLSLVIYRYAPMSVHRKRSGRKWRRNVCLLVFGIGHESVHVH